MPFYLSLFYSLNILEGIFRYIQLSRSFNSNTASPRYAETLRVTPPITPSGKSSPSSQSCTTNKLRLNSPEYTIYQDKDLVAAAESGSIPQELRHRLIRATISNMTAVAFSHPFNRLPSNSEIQEMAKSLLLTYPSLSDSETGDVSSTEYICVNPLSGNVLACSFTLCNARRFYLSGAATQWIKWQWP